MHPLLCSDDSGSLSACDEDARFSADEKIEMGFPNSENDQNSKCRFLDDSFQQGSEGKEQVRRGRPRADIISFLIREGSTSQSRIRCETCSRVFPREKSLQAHMRTHTGERPYKCEYQGCGKAFRQSGQLKTHQRLHTGEKPFVCSVEGCETRFTHANRHCSLHPYASLKRVPSADLPAASRASKSSHSTPQSPGSVQPRRPRPAVSGASKSRRPPAQHPPPRPRKRPPHGVQVPKEVAAVVRRKLFTESNDELLSALALIELAQSSPSLSPQSPLGGSLPPTNWSPLPAW